MTRELSDQGIHSVIDHHQLKTAASLKELARRSGLKRPLLIPSIPGYQSIALLLVLLSFEDIFRAKPVLPLVGMPAGDLAMITLLAIAWHGLKRSASSGFGALALVLLVSFLNPLDWPLGLILAAAALSYGLLISTTNRVRFEVFRSKALKRILYLEERHKKWEQQEAKRKQQEARIEALIRNDEALQDTADTADDDLFTLGPLQAYDTNADTHVNS